jgi:hypothetical protein
MPDFIDSETDVEEQYQEAKEETKVNFLTLTICVLHTCNLQKRKFGSFLCGNNKIRYWYRDPVSSLIRTTNIQL